MATSTLNPVIDQLRRAVLLPDGAGLTDGQLLESFVSRQDEAAFAALVRRHGPMVLGVCRRVLRHHHDAEDACQATFLVLARKAGSVVPRDMAANWLYGVAYRTARKTRTLLARHRVRETQVTEMPKSEATEPDHCWRDLQPLLDQELRRLPDKYRVPIVLCDLEGKTGKEAARQLGWPEGTVASRLSRGRRTLAQRLTRRGLALSAGSLAAVVSRNAASAGVPTSLVSCTVKAASFLAAGTAATTGLISAEVAALTEGVVNAMFLNKVRITLVVLAVIGVVGAGLGGLPFRAAANYQPAVQTSRQQVTPAGGSEAKAVPPVPDKAKEGGAKAAGANKPSNQDQAKQILDMVLKGFQAHQASKGNKAEQREKEALDRNREAFLKAFQIASEIARAQGKSEAKRRTQDQAVLDSCGPAFLRAYERAKTLKKALEGQIASEGKRGEKVLAALDVFLKAGQEFERAVKRHARTQAVREARREIENALNKLTKRTNDRRTALETLEEIERVVRRMKENLRDGTDDK